MEVKFYDNIDDDKLKFAVIVTRYQDKWLLCKHRQRDTYEIPGGHREHGETILETAKRELFEETGALDFEIMPVCVYSVTGKNRVNETGDEMFGMLFLADVDKLEQEIHSEIEKIKLFDQLPDNLTYPDIQPFLFKQAKKVYRQKIIKEWFLSWFDNKWNKFEKVFDNNVYYSESWGPEYNNLDQIKCWFKKWHDGSKLIKWDITSFIHSDNYTFVEWCFACKNNDKTTEFDGISLVAWNEVEKIKVCKEYGSSLPKYNPFDIDES